MAKERWPVLVTRRLPQPAMDRIAERCEVTLHEGEAAMPREPAEPVLDDSPVDARAEAQLRRLQGVGTGKKGQRHELIGAHGYDIKAAMHVIRLLNEGIELMRSGTITLPRPEKELLITIRTGNYGSLERVLSLANSLFRELEEAEAKSGLPEKVDRARISALVSATYLQFL